VSRRPVRAPFMIGLLILLAGLTIGNLRPAAPPPADDDEAAARFTIYLTAETIEAYRDSAGTLPSGLEQVGLADDDLTYAVRDGSYTLTARVGDATVTYVDGEDLAPYAAAYDILVAEEP
jgi:hypothetical protein